MDREHGTTQVASPRTAAPVVAEKPSDTSFAALLEQRRKAEAALDKLLETSPRELSEEIDNPIHLLVQLRDNLIHRLRERNDASDGPTFRRSLEQVNAVLSLVVGVQYPIAGIQWQNIEAARDALAKVFVETTETD